MAERIPQAICSMVPQNNIYKYSSNYERLPHFVFMILLLFKTRCCHLQNKLVMLTQAFKLQL